jgi:methionine sulfoxide reductase heme-binding subunit
MPAWTSPNSIEHGQMVLIDKINAALKRVPTIPLYFIALFPAPWLLWQALSGMLGADPMRVLEHEFGIWALRFMLCALAVTPLRQLTGINLIRFRRWMGVTAFNFAILHLLVYLALDQQFYWSAILGDLYKRPYIIFGMSAFVLLIPLAATSMDAMIRRMGPMNWRKLHRLAYPALVLMVLHYLWLVKSWTTEPLIYAALAILVLGLRGWTAMRPNRPQQAGRRHMTRQARSA